MMCQPDTNGRSLKHSIRAMFCFCFFFRGEVWSAVADNTPGPPQYSPRVSLTRRNSGGVTFTTEKRFLCTRTRCITKEHEREALGLFSPGPAKYLGHNCPPLWIPNSAPDESFGNEDACDDELLCQRRSATASAIGLRTRCVG